MNMRNVGKMYKLDFGTSKLREASEIIADQNSNTTVRSHF